MTAAATGVHDVDICHVECSGCIMQCGMLLVATVFYLHNKPLLCRVNCTVDRRTSTIINVW